MSLESAIQQSQKVWEEWKQYPAPKRGELILEFSNLVKEDATNLALYITDDMGKTLIESQGEVQEIVDICVFAAGLSRQLYGLTMPSERPNHRIQETWEPLGPVGVITAFNFPGAVWAWNFALAAVCGNTVIWKPSPNGVITARGLQHLWNKACIKCGVPQFIHVNQIVNGEVTIGRLLASDRRVPLISATGSTKMGKNVALHVANRFGKVILELGGNNFSIITSNANMDIAIPSCVFAAIGTTGQRCTTLRRLFVHTDVYDDVVQRMVSAYKSIRVGNPYDTSTLIGPLVNVKARDVMHLAIANAIDQGGTVTCGGKTLQFQGDDHCYVEPCIIESPQVLSISKQETFAPILYIVPYTDLDDAIRMGNDVPQGLSSSIFTDSIVEAEYFLPRAVTGIVNINASTSGAEIGGAFGGEKETGGGRESGSDAWKQYMRRVTTTINGGTVVTLAQGIVFE